MRQNKFFINIYLIEEQSTKYRHKTLAKYRFTPKLSDPEIICMEMVGEFCIP